MITVENYFNNDELRCDVFKSKYLQYVTQGVDECFNNIAKEVAGVSIETESQKWENTWTTQLLDGVWRPGGSIISGVNNPTKNISCFNCTTFVIEEDTLESIYQTRTESAKAAAHRQGLGVEFSNVRPAQSPINNSADESEGAINWLKSFDRIADEVGQKGRKPAILGSLKITHPDVPEFITVKSDLDTLKNMNISVQIVDEFMTCLKDNGTWKMSFDLPTGKVVEREMPATELFNMICEQSHKYAEPGLQFIDLMKRYSIQEALGYEITSTNACSEKSLPNRGVCALASLNMASVPHISDSNRFHSFMKEVVYSLVRFMDNVVQYEIDNPHKSPLKEQMVVVQDLREIGIGITNLHQWLYNQGVAYDSEDGCALIEEFFKWYQYYAFSSSAQLAIERGPCPAWKKCNDNNTLIETEFLKTVFNEFSDLKKYFYETGIRNGALLSIAPTGSISMTFPEDCLSSGIEPTIGYSYWRKTRAVSRGEYDYYFVLPSAVKKIVLSAMENGIVDELEYNLVKNFPGAVLDNDGIFGKQLIDVVTKWTNVDILKPAHQIDPFKKVQMMGRVQKWVDAAISVTYNLPYDYDVANIGKLYIAAYNENIKALSIYREGSREGILIFEDPITHKEKYKDVNKPSQICTDRPKNIVLNCAPKRDKEIKCDIHHHKIHGEEWIVLIGLHNNSPYEIFAGKKNEDFNISKNITNGTITKSKDGKYTLSIEVRKSHIQYDDIADLFMNEEYQALTRMISLALRHGVYHEFIVGQLKKSSSFVGDFMAVVSRVLNKYIKDYKFGNEKVCPMCGEGLINEGGCNHCSKCDYSKCS